MTAEEVGAGRHRGRFAPTPSGPLHIGSLAAAVASYLDARSRGGEWLVRMEDLDGPRVRPAAEDEILRTLEAAGLGWDGAVMRQSERGEAYRAALEKLREAGLVYPCLCSRREIADSALPGAQGGAPRYPGTCRGRSWREAEGSGGGRGAAWRMRTGDEPVSFDDRLRGAQRSRLEPEAGDFVLRRADGIVSYQLAVVVDDAAQGVTSVVRGADLLDSTFRQIYLQDALGLRRPEYLHIPVVAGEDGEKLSKQTRAHPVRRETLGEALRAALSFLGHAPPEELRGCGVEELLRWAIPAWSVARLPRTDSARMG